MFFLFFYVIIKLDIFLLFMNVIYSLELFLLYLDLRYFIYLTCYFILFFFLINLSNIRIVIPEFSNFFPKGLTANLLKKGLIENHGNV